MSVEGDRTNFLTISSGLSKQNQHRLHMGPIGELEWGGAALYRIVCSGTDQKKKTEKKNQNRLIGWLEIEVESSGCFSSDTRLSRQK